MSQDSFAAVSLQQGYLLHGHYKILNVLGRGGFAFTYKAQDKDLDRFVAIKEYFPASIAARSGQTVTPIDANSREGYADGLHSFVKEAQALAKFRNEHICSVLDYFQENGTAYLIMPYLSGESLDMVLKKCPSGVMNSDSVRKWLIPLLDALKEIHSASYMHRDIKPSNIYISYAGDPILIDFGAARASVGRTHGYTVVLTPEYAPPEQSTTDISAQGPWTDIYALAAVAYRCLIGSPPPDAQKRILAKANGKADPLDSGLPSLRSVADAGLYAFIEKALVLPYAKRLQSVDEVVAVLGGKIEADFSHEQSKQPQTIASNAQLTKIKNFCFYLGNFLFLLYSIFIITHKDLILTEADIETKLQSQNNKTYSQQPNYQLFLNNHEEGIKNYKGGLYSLAKDNFIKCISYKNPENSSIFTEKQAACANYLALMYSEGKGGLPVNQVEAFKLLQFAANAGYRSAQYNLAKRYKNGVGTKKDTSLAVYWYEKAAQAGDADAAKTLAQIFENGHGNVSVSKEKAYEWYKFAYNLNKSDKSIKSALQRLQKYGN